MATPSQTKKNTSSQKLAAYEAELRRSRIRNIIYICIVSIFVVFFTMMIYGNHFENFLSYFGLSSLYNEERGVYADCSKPENKDNAYCQRENDRIQKSWDSISKGGGKSAPFSLSGR